MTEHIKIENANNILTLTFARPDKKNALTNVMYGALADALVAGETDRAVRAIVIRGEGDMFTAGNDVGEFAAMATGAMCSMKVSLAWKREGRAGSTTELSSERRGGRGGFDINFLQTGLICMDRIEVIVVVAFGIF